MNIIEFNYISPMSTYVFDNKRNHYYLVHISSHNKNNVTIHKILLSDLRNINKEVRAMAINKAVTTSNNFEYPTQSLLIFEHNILTNILKLLFVGNLNLIETDFNNMINLTMKQPSKVVGDFRSGKYIDDTSFLSEQFFNYETFESDDSEKCMLFITKLKKTNMEIIKSYVCKFDRLDSKYIFNRYHNNVVKEQQLIDITKLCENNTITDYMTLLKNYNIDVNKYNPNNLSNKTFRALYLRKINSKFRPLKFNQYINNLITCPVDGRISAFHINPDIKFKLGNLQYTLNDIIKKPFPINEGSGYVARMTPSDYQRVSMPYAGYLTEASIFGGAEPYYISLKFESTYFMPPDVHERDYRSVLLGHNDLMSKEFPELVDVQPRIKLIFYVILIGSLEQESVVFTNHKLLKLKNKIKLNTTIKINNQLWLEQGEEIAGFNCLNNSTVLFITNRPMDFTSDIKYHSKLENNDNLGKKIECYIKCKDVVGILL